MYQPPHHKEDRIEILHALIRAHPLGLLISADAAGPLANPLPFLLDEDGSAHGMLRTHLSRANAQWRAIKAQPDATVLVVFQGVNTYITPSWYETKRETGKVVPTWNYAIVQVRGPARVVEDHDWLATQIRDLTGAHEGGRQEPRQVDDAPAPFVEAQIRGIVGLEIEITDIQGKWKVSQNRPEADRAGVARGLEESAGSGGESEMASLVRRFGDRRA